MKTIRNTFLAAFCLLVGFLPAALAQGDDNKITIDLSQPNKPGLLKVSLLNGSIKVTGYGGKDVVISYDGRENRRLAKPEESGGLRRLSGNNIGLEIEEEGNTVTVKANSIFKSVDLEIQVPHEFSLKLNNLTDGNVVVEDINGEIDVDNLNGSIDLRQVSGSASASTLNGDIKASFRKLTPNKPMAFSNLNGTIDLTLPASAKFNAKLKSDNGDVFTDFDLTPEREAMANDKEENQKGRKVYVDKWLQGKMNGGGPELLMKNFNGNIYIRKAK
ncbi:MAG: DUF4097 family beta strand repeat-containing protein [Adhaeribacter sp.]